MHSAYMHLTGRLIHVSDFIKRWCLTCSFGQKWWNHSRCSKDYLSRLTRQSMWDNSQLMDQMRSAIETFKAAHPDCQALFIFDQSSAHTSLPTDALKAFEMNKTNGGKEHCQHDTIIPESNPDPQFCSQAQSMTTTSGEAKGLKQTLEEHGFNVSKVKAKCSPMCPFESTNCCMAQLLSQQDNFVNQECLSHSSKRRVISVSSYPSFIVSSVQLRW